MRFRGRIAVLNWLGYLALVGMCGAAAAQHRGPAKIGNAHIRVVCAIHNAPKQTLNAKTKQLEDSDDWNAVCELHDAQTNKLLAQGRLDVEHPAGLVDVAERVEDLIAAVTLRDKQAFLLGESGDGR